MRYRLRTLLILLAIGPPMLAAVWWIATASYGVQHHLARMSLLLSPAAAFALCGVSCVVQWERPAIQHRKLVQFAILSSAGTFALAWLLAYLWLNHWFAPPPIFG